MNDNEHQSPEEMLRRCAEQVRLRGVVSRSPYEYLLHPMRLAAMILLPLLLAALNWLAKGIVPWVVVCFSPFFLWIVVEATRKRSIKRATAKLRQLEVNSDPHVSR
jgi:hypothetical protein